MPGLGHRRQLFNMDFFFGIREPVSQAAARIMDRGYRAIPSDHKKVFITLFFIIHGKGTASSKYP